MHNMESRKLSFVYGVAERLALGGDIQRTKRAAEAEAADWFSPEEKKVLEALFSLVGTEPQKLRELVRAADRDAPSAKEMAAAAHLRALAISERRASLAGG